MHLVISAVAALNQVAVFMVALVFAALGLVLLGNALYWRLHAVGVQGELVGVRQSGQCFRSVYRFSLPSGESCEGTSTEGSSSLRARQTGMQVPLWVIPERPSEVQEARSHIWSLIGAVLLAIGFGLFYVAATHWPVGPMTWLIAVLFVGHLAFKLLRTLKPKDKQLLAGWRALRAPARADSIAQTPLLSITDVQSTPEFRDAETRRATQARRWRPVLLIAGPALVALSIYLGRELLRLETGGYRASGVVQSLASSHSSQSVTYHPVVSFTSRDGAQVRFRDPAGSNPPSYRVGDRVAVLYLPDQPASALIDRGLWNWLPSGFTGLFGLLLSFWGLKSPDRESQTA